MSHKPDSQTMKECVNNLMHEAAELCHLLELQAARFEISINADGSGGLIVFNSEGYWIYKKTLKQINRD